MSRHFHDLFADGTPHHRRDRRGWRIHRAVLAALCAGVIAACGSGDGSTGPGNGPTGSGGGNAPHTRVPDELVGTWYSGDVSPTEFYDPNTGHWGGNGYGQGVFYRFSAEGRYEYGYMNWSELCGCGTKTMFHVKGTIQVDEDVQAYVLHAASATRHEINTCAGTDTKVGYTDAGESVYYHLQLGDDGGMELWTRDTDGADTRWYRLRKVDW